LSVLEGKIILNSEKVSKFGILEEMEKLGLL